MQSIAMTHIGKIDAVGTVQVFGLSQRRINRRKADTIYLSYAGPPTASDAVWAMLVEKRALDFTDLRGRPHRINHSGYPSLEGNEAPWKRYVTRIESLSIDHTILLDKRFTDPAYAQDVAYTFAFEGANLATLVGYHVSQSVDIAVFPQWYDSLLALGQRERLIMPLNNWAHPVMQITLDRTRWTNAIAAAVKREALTWPGETPNPDAKRLLDNPTPEEPSTITDTTLDTQLKQALNTHLKDAARAVAVAKAIEGTKKHGWRGNPIKEREIKRAIYEVVNGERQTEALFDVLCSLEQPTPTTEEAASHTVTHEGDWTWISFTRKPSEAIRERLKLAGFRWGKRRKAWYVRKHVEEEVLTKLVA
jgi:hypothetical protein